MENKETFEEIQQRYFKDGFEQGAKWQAEQDKKLYSEEEVLRIITSCKEYLSFGDEFNEKQWFERFEKKIRYEKI